MEKISEYIVINGNGSLEIHLAVTAKIKEGWHPQGGVAISQTNIKTSSEIEQFITYHQAMIR